MSKPDWKDAPKRANFLAQDLNGSWYWYELEPYVHAKILWATYGASWLAQCGGRGSKKWQKTLERRP